MPEKKPEKPLEGGQRRWLVTYLLLAVFGVLLVNEYLFMRQHLENIPYSEFLKYLNQGQVTDVNLGESRIQGKLKDPRGNATREFITIPPDDPNLVARLQEKNVTFKVEARSPLSTLFYTWVLPLLLFYFVWAFLLRRMSGSGSGNMGNMFGFARSKARIYAEKDTKTIFDDVAGANEAKEELQELVSFLQDPKEFARLGGRAPKGILLVGPPGTGKTLLARAVAGEAKVAFFSINGSEFVEMFVGLGAARVRDLFQQARSQAPCIIFIDEIDALGRSRALAMGGAANDEKEQTLNQLLAEMDGFDSSEGVIILAATNRPEVLDPALLRAGRFDRQVLVSLPDKEGRTQILTVHARKIVLEPEVKLERIAGITPGFSGADLANLVNEAALRATRRKAGAVSERDFTLAIERIVAGLEQKKVMNPEEKRRIAFHEMGHATVSLSRSVHERVHKISIIPRGMGALGYTLQRPIEDRYLMDRAEMMTRIAVLLGGRASEIVFFSEVSTGAADDLAKATDIARAMITQYGMSPKLGLASFESRGASYLPAMYQLHERAPFSERTAEQIDSEVKAMLQEGLHMAAESLELNRDFLEEGTRHLLEKETLEEYEVQGLWEEKGTKLPVAPILSIKSG